MQTITTTKTDQTLAAAQQRHSSDPVRAELLARTRRFKASWIELGEALTDCQKANHFVRWGYPTFEEYCRLELHLKTTTVNKLIGSFGFLKRSAPEVLTRDGVERVYPTIEGVAFLRKAEEAAGSREEAQEVLAEVRKAVLDDGASAGKVQKLFGDQLFPRAAAEEKSANGREVVRLAAKLITMLNEVEIPSEVRKQVEDSVGNLIRLLHPTK